MLYNGPHAVQMNTETELPTIRKDKTEALMPKPPQ